MKKKKYKITKTELFKEQEKKLPENVKKALAGALKSISKNPTTCAHTMSLFEKPSPEELRQWMGKTRLSTIDLVLEYLHTKDCLNKGGRSLAHEFWKKYIREDE